MAFASERSQATACTLEKPKMRSDSKGSLAPYSGAHKAPSPGRPGLSPARLWLLRGLFVPCVDSRPPPLPPVGSASTAGSCLLPCCGEGWGEERPPSDLLIIKAIRIILSGPAVGLFLPAAGVSSSFWSHKTWKEHFKRFPGTPPPPPAPLWMLSDIFHLHGNRRGRRGVPGHL